MKDSEWVPALWDELDAMDKVDSIRIAGDWITYVTSHLLPDLATYRRTLMAELLKDPEWDATSLADRLGTRPSTVIRLASEGRTHRRG